MLILHTIFYTFPLLIFYSYSTHLFISNLFFIIISIIIFLSYIFVRCLKTIIYYCFIFCLSVALWIIYYTLLLLFLSISTFTSLFVKLSKFLNTPLQIISLSPFCYRIFESIVIIINLLVSSKHNLKHSFSCLLTSLEFQMWPFSSLSPLTKLDNEKYSIKVLALTRKHIFSISTLQIFKLLD